jgi:hypothetical protein
LIQINGADFPFAPIWDHLQRHWRSGKPLGLEWRGIEHVADRRGGSRHFIHYRNGARRFSDCEAVCDRDLRLSVALMLAIGIYYYTK